GSARVRLHRLHVPGRPDRARHHRDDLLQSLQAADRGLHHRALRLTRTACARSRTPGQPWPGGCPGTRIAVPRTAAPTPPPETVAIMSTQPHDHIVKSYDEE